LVGGTILALAGPVPVAQAATCSVPSGSYGTITAAVNDGTCDTINVAAGNYVETLTINRSLTLQGAGKTSTVIDANGTNRVILISGNNSVVVRINNLRVTGGDATPAPTKGNGGGILVTGGAILYAENVQIDENIGNTDSTGGSGFGGGLAVLNNSSAYLTNAMVFSNRAKPSGTGLGQGGGLYVNNGYLSVVDSQIMTNTANVNGTGAGKGGGLFVNANSQINLSGNTWQANTARSSLSDNVEGSGGAIAVEFPTGTTVMTATNDIFTKNTGNASNSNLTGSDKARGGAIFLNTTNTGGRIRATLTGVTINNNVAKAGSSNTGEGQGGAIYARHTTLAVHQATILDNKASMSTASDAGDGGGIYMREPLANDSLDVINSILAGNSAFQTPGSGDGAQLHLDFTNLQSNNAVRIVHSTLADDNLNPKQALYYFGPDASDTLAITNTIVASHAIGIQNINATGKGTARYMLFYGNTDNHPSPGATAFPDTTGWIAGDPDPLFVDPAGGDYHIQAGSPAIDQGTLAGVAIDIDGGTRDSNPDIGADEEGVGLAPGDNAVYLPLIIKN
jgi:predicted outer membrane repeat protein